MMQEYRPPRRFRHVEALVLRNFASPFTPSPLYECATYVTVHFRDDLSPFPPAAARDALAVERADFVSSATIGGSVFEWAVSVPEDASSKRFCTVCVRAVKVHRARFLLGASSGPQAGPQERQQLERDAESGDVLRARKIGEEVVVATVDIDLQELVFEGAAVSADTDFPVNMLHLRMADGHYAPYSIAPAGSLLRQPPPTAREFSYAKQMTWDDACAGSKELRAAQETLAMASEARRRSETKAAAVMAERDAGIARRQALEAARRRLQAHRARRAEAERSLKAAKAEADRIVEDLSRRGAALTSSADSLNVEQNRIAEWRRVVQGAPVAGRLQDAQRALCSRRWRMVRDVAMVYPIAPADGGGYGQPSSWLDGSALRARDASKQGAQLCILGLPLDSSVARTPLEGGPSASEPESRERAAAALGHVAAAVDLIASYLGVVLRYPILPRSSRSHVLDKRAPLHLQDGGVAGDDKAHLGRAAMRSGTWGAAQPAQALDGSGRALPLYLDGGPDRTLFAYAVFLLNKDIEQILNAYGLASVSPRHTLHNLLRIYAAAFVVETTASDGSFPPRQPLESLPWQGPAAQHPLALSGRSESAGILNPPGLVSAPLPPRLDFLEQAHQQQLPGAAGDADASAARTSGTPVPAAAASRPATPLLGV